MTNIVDLECLCGTVKGKVKVVPHCFFHVHCLCCDCQKFASFLKNEQHILDEHGGTELLQTYPDYIEITEGQASMSCVQIKHKGLFRWYARCCNMPIANTMSSSKVPFVGISVKLMKFANDQQKMEILGPVTLKAFGKYSIGEMPMDAHPKFPFSFIPKILGFMLKGILMRKNSPSPFFKGVEPLAKIEVGY